MAELTDSECCTDMAQHTCCEPSEKASCRGEARRVRASRTQTPAARRWHGRPVISNRVINLSGEEQQAMRAGPEALAMTAGGAAITGARGPVQRLRVVLQTRAAGAQDAGA